MSESTNSAPPERRSGTKLIYQLEPGEDFGVLPDGRVVVVHPERAPKIIDHDGKVSPPTFAMSPEIQASLDGRV